jgi:hypothetical protein
MDHLEVRREKIARLRSEIAAIQELNQEYRLREWVGTEAQVAHGKRHERLQAIQQELAQVADLGRRILSVEKIKEQNRARLPVVEQKRLLVALLRSRLRPRCTQRIRLQKRNAPNSFRVTGALV